MDEHLLPSNSTPFEQAASLAINVVPRVATGVDAIRTAKLVSIPDSFIPFLIYEYGLGPPSAYVADQRYLLDAGIDWQRVRGTPDAIFRALAWIGYGATIEEARITRRRWHLFQLAMNRLRDQEEPDLENIEGVVNLSVAVRSHFYRAFWLYDVREMDFSWRRWSGSRYSGSSGVRIREGGVKWSYGREHSFALEMPRGELVALNAWQEPVIGGTQGWGLPTANAYGSPSAIWGNFSWDSTALTWDGDAANRESLIAAALDGRPIWVTFRRADGSIIGYRRARAAHPVEPLTNGPYTINGASYAPFMGGRSFYIEALTDFGDGNGNTAAQVSLLFDAVPVNTATPGLLWAAPGEITGGVDVALQNTNIPMGRTVRERLRFHLTF